MLINNLYYILRPVIPRSVQIYLRRTVAGFKLKSVGDVWPIDPASGAPPRNWKGWPGGKRFALVLTHDVETARGQSRCLDLAEIEKSRGLRSVFNFVAERYPADPEVRRHLVENGFELGSHGVYHDGKKFKSWRIFQSRVPKINKYLKQWGAVGFRSPAMHCRLDWLHHLDIEYDCSTFDTDPFEPQSTGMGTIFPFLVNGEPGDNGFVELPYTLPQDFCLFVILEQKNIDIWKRKLDWIVEHGGMALVLTHPDYMNFGQGRATIQEYPSDFYKQLLDYVEEKYSGQYWNPLPREVARFWRETRGADESERPFKRKPLRVCMPVYSFYETDIRVIRYAEALAKRGDQVDVLSLRRKGQSKRDVINGVRILRIQERIENEKARSDYLLRLVRFFFRSALVMTRLHLKKPYDVIHVHSVPDFEVFAALVPKLTGAKVILDIHDIVPEFYASKFGSSSESCLFKLLLAIEKLSAAFSDHVIISNHLWRERLIARSVTEEKCTAFLNYPDHELFRKRERFRNDGRKIMIYPGSLNHHQGLDIAIRALSKISGALPEAELHIYGDGGQRKNLADLTAELGLDHKVKFFREVPINEIADAITNSDLGIVPKRSNSFGNEAFSTKVLEFMSLGVPVLASSTRIDRYYFNDSVVQFFKSQDEDDLADKMLFMLNNESYRNALAARALDFVKDFFWDLKKNSYLDLVDSLASCSK